MEVNLIIIVLEDRQAYHDTRKIAPGRNLSASLNSVSDLSFACSQSRIASHLLHS
jgi:hypothetical protein